MISMTSLSSRSSYTGKSGRTLAAVSFKNHSFFYILKNQITSHAKETENNENMTVAELTVVHYLNTKHLSGK